MLSNQFKSVINLGQNTWSKFSCHTPNTCQIILKQSWDSPGPPALNLCLNFNRSSLPARPERKVVICVSSQPILSLRIVTGGIHPKKCTNGLSIKKHLVSKCSFIHIVQMKFNCVTHIQCKDSISFSGQSHIQPTGRSSRLGAIRRWFFGRWYNSLDCYMLLCQFIRLSSCYTLHWLEK